MEKILNIEDKKWLGSSKPIIISGPCSAETEEQFHETVKQIADKKLANVLRAGIWKPRTRPNSFEGVGEVGLKWLKDAGNSVGLPVSTEVANAKHVEACLKAGIDILWLGARTTVNPFSVQEIADALKGVDVPVLVKNPINPDLNLWIGALERINKAGINKIGAIHRGFSTFEKTVYRNVPKWEIPIELKRLFPELPMICDPSHIAGKRELLELVSQKALDLDMDGLMIESHRDPSVALSDAAQQVTPNGLEELINNLIVRSVKSDNDQFKSSLDKLRQNIDLIDDEIIQKLADRMAVVNEIGVFKKNNEVTVLQVKRWDEIIKKRLDDASQLGLEGDFVKGVLEIIHKASIKRQMDIMNQ